MKAFSNSQSIPYEKGVVMEEGEEFIHSYNV
jgi:hypothetical protein